MSPDPFLSPTLPAPLDPLSLEKRELLDGLPSWLIVGAHVNEAVKTALIASVITGETRSDVFEIMAGQLLKEVLRLTDKLITERP